MYRQVFLKMKRWEEKSEKEKVLDDSKAGEI